MIYFRFEIRNNLSKNKCVLKWYTVKKYVQNGSNLAFLLDFSATFHQDLQTTTDWNKSRRHDLLCFCTGVFEVPPPPAPPLHQLPWQQSGDCWCWSRRRANDDATGWRIVHRAPKVTKQSQKKHLRTTRRPSTFSPLEHERIPCPSGVQSLRHSYAKKTIFFYKIK